MNWKKIAKYLFPKEHIAGISLSDSRIALLLFEEEEKNIIAKLEVELEEGIIEKGVLKNKEALEKILEGLRNSPELREIKNLYVIVSLGGSSVYYKTFSLPIVPSTELAAAAELNLKMISPIDFQKSYSDWELLRASHEDGIKYNIAAVFAEKDLIDPYLEAFKLAGFLPLAVEFQALSVWRLFLEKKILPEKEKSCLAVFVSADGLNFSIMNIAGLQFDYFQNWREVIKSSSGISGGDSLGELKREDFFKIFDEQARKVYSFFSNKFAGEISCFHLFSPLYSEALEQIIFNQFKLPSAKIPLSFQYSPGFFASSGAALRGLVSRVDDVGISLMQVGTEQEYRQRRYLSFISFWSKITISTLVLVLAAFFGVWLFFNFSQKGLRENLANLNLKINEEKFDDLKNQAAQSNQTIAQILKAKEATKDWTEFFRFWEEKAKEIGLAKLVVSGPESKVLFRGWTNAEKKMLDFKNEIEKSGYFSEVEIPLQSIIKQKNGVEFNLNFKIKELP